jgi:iron complex outermembrane receptor protein
MLLKRSRLSLLAGAALAAAGSTAVAASETENPAKTGDVAALSHLSLEELAQIEVTSASKQAEPIGRAPTAIYVITDEDIARSTATSLPEVLRLAPNLQVQRVDGRQYAVTARGFNGVEPSNKLLVLVDGRTIYTPLHSGIFWELHAPLLEDLDRIEVISGPGGTLYGPNAVNGVVNITSKDSRETAGGLVRGTIAANEGTLALRLGTRIGENAGFRVYASAFDRRDQPDGPGPDVNDRFRGWQAGFRTDFGAGADTFTLQGDVFDNKLSLAPGDGNDGHNLLARWTHKPGGASSFQFQAYYDKFERQFTQVNDSLETFDAEGQYNARLGAHEIVGGAGLRTTKDRFVNNLNGFVLDPESRRLWIGNAFVQDRFALAPTLDIIAGVKLEQSSFTGLQVLPNLRLAYHPGENSLFWAAVSRAVRTPSRIDRQLVFPGLLRQAVEFRTEKLVAFEAGYRGRPGPRTTLSVNLFYNLYDDIRTTEFAPGGALPISLRNSLKGSTFGAEAWATQQIAPWWRASLGVAALGKNFHLKKGAVDISNRAGLGADPDVQFIARSSMDLTDRLQLDVGVRAQDDLNETHIGGYVEAEARLGYRLLDNVELYVAGSNLLHRAHAESNDPGRAQLNERSIHLGTRLRF